MGARRARARIAPTSQCMAGTIRGKATRLLTAKHDARGAGRLKEPERADRVVPMGLDCLFMSAPSTTPSVPPGRRAERGWHASALRPLGSINGLALVSTPTTPACGPPTPAATLTYWPVCSARPGPCPREDAALGPEGVSVPLSLEGERPLRPRPPCPPRPRPARTCAPPSRARPSPLPSPPSPWRCGAPRTAAAAAGRSP